MANANFNNYYPHTLKVDEIVADQQKKIIIERIYKI